MQVERQWQDEPELFEAVAAALDGNVEDVQVRCLDEEDGYGHRGSVTLRTADGRTFRLLLAEVL